MFEFIFGFLVIGLIWYALADLGNGGDDYYNYKRKTGGWK